MDKNKRLTKWEEWEIGASYMWSKSGRFGFITGPYRCISANEKDGHIVLSQSEADVEGMPQRNWKGRFVKVCEGKAGI